MAIGVGSRVGPYEITALLGEGGMGKVWRAHHTGLKRDDALKVLPDAFASDADRLVRFQREAQVLASLNHPNIAHVYGLEQAVSGQAGVQALVMELVEGPTLADRIARGPIPLDEALPIARQIAEALEAAHERGIIHRDLKPANVKVRPDGTVKVLDFGLAKGLEPCWAMPDTSHSPTITSPALMTGAGVLLGTAAYMAPEQARGKPVDRRADIWAFGCVLFEMLTGQRAFQGEDVTVTLARVVERDPDWSALPAHTPAPLRRLMRRCLEKDRRRRLDSAAAIRLEIEDLQLPDSSSAGSAAIAAVRPTGWRRVLAPAAALLIGGAFAGGAVWIAMRPAPPRVVRTEITTAGATALVMNNLDPSIAITPDGSRVIYRGNNRFLVRALDQLEPDVLSGVGEARGIFVSPDGQWVGFFDGQRLVKRVAITGGPPLTVTPVDGSWRGGTWGPDGTIVFATNALQTGLQRVPATGGDPIVLTKPDQQRGEADHLWPAFLPGGQAVLFTILVGGGNFADSQIAVLDLTTGTHKILVRGGHHAHYAPTGHLVYGAGGTLHAVAFDLDRLELRGTPVPVLERIQTITQGGMNVAFAADGTMVYVPGGAATQALRSLVWVDRTGREDTLSAPARAYTYLRISPDGTRLGVSIFDQENDVWTWDFRRATLTRLTFTREFDRYSVWTPDSGRIVFTSTTGGGLFNLYWQAADGTGRAERLTESATNQFPMSFSPDGTRLVFYETRSTTGNDIMVLSMAGGRRASPLVQTMFAEMNAEVSPDGRWLAYQSNESGQNEIFVRPFPDVNGGRWQTSSGGGTRPLWARNGRELFYLSPSGALMRVAVETGSTSIAFGTPALLFEGPYFTGTEVVGGAPGRTYDISPDGRRFLMIKEDSAATDSATTPKLIVVQNWDQELRRLVPVD